MTSLDHCLEIIARVPVLLVASDYDGTISPIVKNPDQARPHREAIVALRSLASLPQTHVAVISGRALCDLASMTGLPEDIHLVGSHGSEFDLDFAMSLPREASELRQRVLTELKQIAGNGDGFLIEEKPASIAFHYRNADEVEAARALKSVRHGPAAIEGVYTKHGKKVLELGVVATSKGKALETIRNRVGASAVIFFGDDVTDEDAFGTLRGPDLSIKVGPGESQASYFIDGPEDVARQLARLSELRSNWLAGSDAVPIEHHSMLSDQRTTALLTPTARVTWWCPPRIDAPALFAELLGGPAAGHFSITPVNGDEVVEQRYLGDSLALHTRFSNFTITDFLDCSGGRPSQRAGRCDLIRLVEGTGRVKIEFAPRLDFGRVPTRLMLREGGVEIEDTHDPIVLRSPGIEWTLREEGPHQSAHAEVEFIGQTLTLELRYGTGSLREFSTSPGNRLERTLHYWNTWSERLILPELEPEIVRRSALILKGLCYGPEGSIAAAATTSLPESLGGVRNWDYRYCWLRDAAMTATTFVRLGSTHEAMHLLNWMCGVVESCESPERLQPLYDMTGGMLGAEGEIGDLAGYRGSRPVRIGNAASRQVQLDVFGPVVQLVASLSKRDAPLTPEHWRLVEAMVQAVERRWQEPDHGIWEIRQPRRHHVHSKVMCWVTVDRAVLIGEGYHDRRDEHWIVLRDAIADDVLEKGYKKNVNAFTAAYDGNDLDASALTVGLSGLIAPDDPRFLGTIKAVETHLRDTATVYRYRIDDGLPGLEGGFHLCTSWLIEAYLLVGRRDDARRLFEQYISLTGPTGLLSEQYDHATGLALGNVPQAYSHLGLIENAIKLSEISPT